MTKQVTTVICDQCGNEISQAEINPDFVRITGRYQRGRGRVLAFEAADFCNRSCFIDYLEDNETRTIYD